MWWFSILPIWLQFVIVLCVLICAAGLWFYIGLNWRRTHTTYDGTIDPAHVGASEEYGDALREMRLSVPNDDAEPVPTPPVETSSDLVTEIVELHALLDRTMNDIWAEVRAVRTTYTPPKRNRVRREKWNLQVPAIPTHEWEIRLEAVRL